MTQAKIKNVSAEPHVEPLLPIEKKLIAWSLGTGLVLLVVLIALNHLFPIRV